MNIGKAPSVPAGSSFGTSVERSSASSAGAKSAPQDTTAPKFSDTWNKLQATYGAKAEKPREIKKTLGKDDFLKLMVTQMQHQDPTSPFKAEQMAQQMAQYSSVEQLQNMNSKLERMTTANQPLERMAMTGLIGKTVTVDKERFPHNEGNKTPLGFELGRDAAEVSVSIVAPTGEAIFSQDLGAMKKGSQTFVWEGIQGNTLSAKSGQYQFVVQAVDAKGSEIRIDSKTQARVVGVSFEGKDPALLIGDPAAPQKVLMSNVIRIDSQPGGMIPGAGSLAEASGKMDPHAVAQAMAHDRMAARNGAAAAQSSNVAAQGGGATTQKAVLPDEGNFFSFRKGQGSETLEKANLNAETREALAQYEVQKAEASAANAAREAADSGSAWGEEASDSPGLNRQNEAKGFPNGLNN